MSAVTADRRHMRRDARRVSVIFPTGMLGGGFPAETIERGIELGADAIAVDGGSTDSGPYYLGTGTAKTTEAAVERDLHVLLTSAREADIPLVVTSCGTAGTNSGVDWVAGIVDAIALMRGLPPGPTWHAAKTVECGGLCTTDPQSGGVLVDIDDTGFTVRPLDPNSACTPTTVAAHMLYENADPFRMREPSGTLDTSQAEYRPVDDKTVRVEGSRFEPATQHTIKLEGSAIVGYETIALVGIRDPNILAEIDTWIEILDEILTDRVRALLGLDRAEYETQLSAYGHNAVLGRLDPDTATPREVGVLFQARARDQGTATAIAKIANPLLLHLPLRVESRLPSFAFATSPPEIERGAAYEFVLNHTIDVASPAELFRTETIKVSHG